MMAALTNMATATVMAQQLLYALLLVGVVIAAAFDIAQRRIPNWVNASLVGAALLVYVVAFQWAGLFFCCKGLAFGFLLLFVPYLLGGIGAGDVKLMAAVGAVLGVEYTWQAFLGIAISGGVAAIGLMAVRGELLLRLRRVGLMLYGLVSGLGLEALKVERSTLKRDGIPYGVVIAVGIFGWLLWRWWTGQGLPHPQL